MNRLYIFCLMILTLSSCGYFEYDNYEEPNSGIDGKVVDKKTNEPFYSETANSYKVEYYELSWEAAGHANTQSRFFWGKADGTFTNTKIFAGEYRITLKEGAFYAPDPEVVTLKKGKLTNLNYAVTPYARVKIDEITLSGTKQNNLVIDYTVEDTQNEIDITNVDKGVYTLSEAQVFISSRSPNVGVNNTESKYTVRAVQKFTTYTPGTPIAVSEKNVRNLPPGKYWVRIGVRTGNPGKKYNFSTIQEIVIPDLDN
ncbi:DUF3823 domain-containing protein [Bacteroides sp.]